MPFSLAEQALGHPAKIRLLRVLRKPGAGYMSINQLARATSLNAVTLARALRSLQALGLTTYIQAGKAQLWRIAEGYAASVIEPVLNEIEKGPSLIDKLIETVGSSVPSAIEKIILFGSIARNEQEAGSDIDLLVLVPEDRDKAAIDPFLNELTERASRFFWMNPAFLIRSKAEWRKLSPKLKESIAEGVILYEKKTH